MGPLDQVSVGDSPRARAAMPLGSLDQVPIGDSTRVASLDGDDPTTCRLLELGLTPGVRVRVVRRAPLGDPLELELRGYRLSIRRTDARRVAVTAAPASPR
ncbi:MAG: FeoA family protein [Pirellulales bacterium]|jgi:Fe2+ transport system protein FeoA